MCAVLDQDGWEKATGKSPCVIDVQAIRGQGRGGGVGCQEPTSVLRAGDKVSISKVCSKIANPMCDRPQPGMFTRKMALTCGRTFVDVEQTSPW